MDRRIESLRAALAAVPRTRNTQPYPRELRARVVVVAKELCARGESVESVSSALGVRHETLRRWMEVSMSSEAAPVRPVRVEVGPSSAPVTLASPSGWRIEGLSLDDAWALLRMTA